VTIRPRSACKATAEIGAPATSVLLEAGSPLPLLTAQSGPDVLIFATSIAFKMLADAIRDFLDVKDG
jgi:hypothetical protein